jgi:hypothetical protein
MAPWQRPYAYILVAILGCSLPYILVQPTLRYRYMISTLLIFCALDGAFRLIAHIRASVLGKAERVRPTQFVTVGAGEASATPDADTRTS